jgi:hypothetical protein
MIDGYNKSRSGDRRKKTNCREADEYVEIFGSKNGVKVGWNLL